MNDAHGPQGGAPPQGGPEMFLQMSFSHVPARVLAASVRLGLFSHIAGGARTAADVAAAASASARGTRMLLDALVTLGLLMKERDHYALTPPAAQYLVRESPDYVGAVWEGKMFFEPWEHLTEVVRTGRPFRRLETSEAAEQFFPALVRALHVMSVAPARRMAEALGAGAGGDEGLRVLDVACGSAVWSIAVAELDPRARVTAQDFPQLFETTREYLRRHGVEDRYDFLPGNLREVEFGEGLYDLAILGNIVHSEGEASSRDLLRRLRRALRPGGRVAVIDMIPNDERTAPPFPLFFALNMLVNTEEGDTYTLAEYAEWLRDAGFPHVSTADIGSHSPLIVGRRD